MLAEQLLASQEVFGFMKLVRVGLFLSSLFTGASEHAANKN
jgi:hypothetical protein